MILLNGMFLKARLNFLWILCFASCVWAQEGSSISIQVQDLRNGDGQLAVSVFDLKKPQGFPGQSESAVDTMLIPLQGKKEVHVRTKKLPEGDYAIAILHDENSDGKFNTGLFGYPKEGFGFSNNPRIFFGPPSIEKALVRHSLKETEITVRIKYF